MSPAPGGFHDRSALCPRRDAHATHLWGDSRTLASATSCPGLPEDAYTLADAPAHLLPEEAAQR